MPYATVSDVEAYTSYAYTDFRQSGQVMSHEQWNVLVGMLLDAATATINKFCGVTSFGQMSYVEVHTGKNRDQETGVILESNRKFYLWNFPVVSVSLVEEDTASKQNPSSWVTRTRRDTGSPPVGGDYEVLLFGDSISYIRFHNNVPGPGNSVRITYIAGYPVGSDEMNMMRVMTCQIVANALALKKKLQEAIAARNVGTRDSQEMFQITDPRIFTESLQKELEPFRRRRVPGSKTWR